MDNLALTTLPGTRDILPEEMYRWHRVEERIRSTFALYGFEEIRTPIFEATELFARGIGGETDIVKKEMYTFDDQSGRSITLRPEATASVVRSYVEHHLGRGGGLTKLYYLGPMFRYEKKQKGRWRQFYQVGAEVLGSDNPAIEAEVLEMLLSVMDALSLAVRLQVNSVGCRQCRPAYTRILQQALYAGLDNFCEDCRRRAETNPLRVLDCKIESCQPHIERLPMLSSYLCRECRDHFARFRAYLERAGIPYEIVPRLVRGLDYYVRTAFELVSGDLGAQNALAGGGRYDGLSEAIGGPPVQGFGFAMGLDRLILLIPEHQFSDSVPRPRVFLAFLGEAAFHEAAAIARQLRRREIRCHLGFEPASLKSQLRLANRLGAETVVMIGEDDLARGRFPVRRMADSRQWDSDLEGLLDYLTRAGSDRVPTSPGNQPNE